MIKSLGRCCRGVGRKSAQSWPLLASRLISASHIVEKSFFFAGRVTLASSEIRFVVKIARCCPVAGRRLRWRIRSCSGAAIEMSIVSSHRRGRHSVIRVEAARPPGGRRPALVHRSKAASIVRAGSARDDVQANRISRIISLSLGVPCCQNDTHRQKCQSQCAHWDFLQVSTTPMHSDP